MVEAKPKTMRSPSSRGRGSKQLEEAESSARSGSRSVALFTGAWIETVVRTRRSPRRPQDEVALFTGAWIETTTPCVLYAPEWLIQVAFFTGAWIETPA